MRVDRRTFLQLTGAGLALSATDAVPALSALSRAPRAVAFDAFPVFDPRPVFALAEKLFPGRGEALGNAWRTRQFEYQWLRALAGQYVDFRQTTQDALVFSARMLGLELSGTSRDQLMQTYLELRAWPEVPAVLRTLKQAGIRLALLSNATAHILESGIAHAGLAGLFDEVLSTDRVRTFKPDPRAYRLAVDALALQPQEILFVAYAGWDVAGAKWFGYPTFWVNRLGLPTETLGVEADGVGRDLDDLAAFVASRTA